MEINKLIKNMKNTKILLKEYQILNQETKYRIQFNYKNVIDLDANDE